MGFITVTTIDELFNIKPQPPNDMVVLRDVRSNAIETFNAKELIALQISFELYNEGQIPLEEIQQRYRRIIEEYYKTTIKNVNNKC